MKKGFLKVKGQVIPLSKKDIRLLALSALPHICLYLARKGLINQADLATPERIAILALTHSKKALAALKWSVALDHTFIREACVYWKKSNKEVGLVLYCTAVEQCMNAYYQLILESTGWSNEASTGLIRTANIEAKLGWMFNMFIGHSFPTALKTRIQKAFTVRNQIVHYKAVPGRLDAKESSHDKLKCELKNLGRMSPSRDFELLESKFENGMRKIDKHRDLALKASEILAKF